MFAPRVQTRHQGSRPGLQAQSVAPCSSASSTPRSNAFRSSTMPGCPSAARGKKPSPSTQVMSDRVEVPTFRKPKRAFDHRHQRLPASPSPELHRYDAQLCIPYRMNEQRARRAVGDEQSVASRRRIDDGAHQLPAVPGKGRHVCADSSQRRLRTGDHPLVRNGTQSRTCGGDSRGR